MGLTDVASGGGTGALSSWRDGAAKQAALGIHPLAVLIVTIAGGSLFGAIGLILAAPLTSACVKIASDVALARAADGAAEGGRSRWPDPAPPTAAHA